MSIWKVEMELGHRHLALVYEKDARGLRAKFNGRPIGEIWSPVLTRFSVDDEIELRQGDFLGFVTTDILACGAEVLEVIKPAFVNQVEFLPLLSKDGQFYILNVVNVVDCLSYRLSDIEYWEDGKIKTIRRKIFKAGCAEGNTIFKIPERLLTEIYVTEELKTLIEVSNLTGLTFQKIEEQ